MLCCAAQVDDEWILRRLERWGKKDGMPFLGPKKGAILQRIVADKQPRWVVEVGTMAGTCHAKPCCVLCAALFCAGEGDPLRRAWPRDSKATPP